jgi:ketosteroid isomerase-like protein
MAKLNKFLGTVEDTEAAFYDAISRADIEALMAIWAEDDEIICIHPGAPRLVGHAAIRASWSTIFERGGVHIHPVQLHAIQNMMSSVHNVVEEIKRPEHDPQELHILATNVYIKTPRGWRIAVHHASVASGSAPNENIAASMLH